MTFFKTLAAAAVVACLPGLAAAEYIVAKVDLSEQTMQVFYDGKLRHTWPVSTARAGKRTPTGKFTAQWLSRHHKSSLYNNAPMPYSIFFHGNYAVHGTNQISRLGQPASAGCVRLHPDDAAVLFSLARERGLKNTRIMIQN